MTKSVEKVSHMFEQKSFQKRYKRVVGFHTSFEEQKCLVVTHAALDLPIRDRMWHAGDNRSSTLYPIHLDDYTAPCVWRTTSQVKLHIFTKDNIVGNPSQGYVASAPVSADEVPEAVGEAAVFSTTCQ